MPVRTFPLPPSIQADCAAGPEPRVSELGEGRYLIHPAHYDPARVDDEDLQHDHSVRLLRDEEVERLTGAREALLALMTEISQEEWAAGWLDGLEFVLWRRVLADRGLPSRSVELRDLANMAGGWWAYLPGGEGREKGRTFVPMAEWLRLFEASPQRAAWADEESLKVPEPPAT